VNEYVLVEFLAKNSDEHILLEKLENLEDFIQTKDEFEWEHDDGSTFDTWIRVFGKIRSETASLIKLQDPFLAERMRISYIPDELKDKYRK
jgi:hypothetical protein